MHNQKLMNLLLNQMYVKTDGLENIHNFMLKYAVYLDHSVLLLYRFSYFNFFSHTIFVLILFQIILRNL